VDVLLVVEVDVEVVVVMMAGVSEREVEVGSWSR